MPIAELNCRKGDGMWITWSPYCENTNMRTVNMSMVNISLHASSVEEIEEALIAGGWGGGEVGRTKIRQSIGSFIAGHLREAKILKEVNGKIGRHEWSKDKFA